jgi:hypothetical protein
MKVHYWIHKYPPPRDQSRSEAFVNGSKQNTFLRREVVSTLWDPKLEDHPLSAVRDCLFNILVATLHIAGRSSIRNLRTRHVLVTGTHLSRPALSTPFLNPDNERRRFLVDDGSCLRHISEDSSFNNRCPKDIKAVKQISYFCAKERRV